jgi:RNA polymerase sigma-70 factor, ECF subfamily
VWDRDAIEEACKLLDRALRLRRPGPYQLQAAIAACHAQAPTAADTDWRKIAVLYDRLGEIAPTPVVLLNRAVAVAMADGPAAGLALIDTLEANGVLSDYYLLPATRADLLRRLRRPGEAVAAYRRALELVPTEAERRFLLRRLCEVSGEQLG